MDETTVVTTQKTTWQKRLSGFTVSHFSISLFGFVAGFVCLSLSAFLPLYFALYVGASVLLLLYVAAGFWAARSRKWSAPGGKEAFFTFLRPALIAWVWGGLVLVSAMLIQTGELAMLLLWVSAAFASPSFLIVVLSAIHGLVDGGLAGFLIALFLAGGIPPLLFLLGSLWGSRKHGKERSAEEWKE